MSANNNSSNFQRSPRIPPDLPSGVIEIPPPPALQPKPVLRRMQILMSVALPAGFAFGSLGFALASPGGANLGMNLMMVGFMATTSLATVIDYLDQRNEYKKTEAKRRVGYGELLRQRSEQIAQLMTQQKVESLSLDPSPLECVKRAQLLDRRLWERDLRDSDFATVRIGLGRQPFRVQLKAPHQEAALEYDSLVQDAQRLAQTSAFVDGVPVVMPLAELGAVGLVGAGTEVAGLARAVAVQLATHHSPDHLKLAVLHARKDRGAWEWMKTLPHARLDERDDALVAEDKPAARKLLNDIYAALERHAPTDGTQQHSLPSMRCILFLSDPALYDNEPALALLMSHSSGATPIFLAQHIRELPRECLGFVELSSVAHGAVHGSAQFTNTLRSPLPITLTPDTLSIEDATRFARTLAGVQLRRTSTTADVPTYVPLLDLFADPNAATQRIKTVQEVGVLARWQSIKPFEHHTLAVPIGKTAGGELVYINLHDLLDDQGQPGHGAHGLVAGMTGAGKSELLQTLIAVLAANFHPDWVSFFLIDYKGGGMADPFVGLPHLAGKVTNLIDANLAWRALIALESELKMRQMLFAQTGVTYIDDYQQKYADNPRALPPMPRLIIIVDEFAELKRDQPEFMQKLVSAARIGRSLGVHLILATQKPAGVVDDQIWSNSNFRISLRVADASDSNEMLKRPGAQDLPKGGRAYFQVGNNDIFSLVQVGYGGAKYADARSNVQERNNQKVKQLDALMGHLKDVAQRERIKPVPPIWLEPLPAQLLPGKLVTTTRWDGATWQAGDLEAWMKPVIGLVDDPKTREQTPLSLDLGEQGHLAVYGVPGSGKTTLLQTLITSLAKMHSPDELHLYLLDFNSQLLTLFAQLPHVGNVILPDDAERIRRLFRHLQHEINTRKELLLKSGAGAKISNYRALARSQGNISGEGGAPTEPLAPMPDIVVVIDNYLEFANAYPDEDDTLALISREGRAVGIHLVLTANNPVNIKSRVASNMALAVTFELADKGDYAGVVGRTEGLQPKSLPGRGLVRRQPPLEFHTALPANGETEPDRIQALQAMCARMRDAWGKQAGALKIETLPDVLSLSHVLSQVHCADCASNEPATIGSPIGLTTDDLRPFDLALNDGPHFMVVGDAQTGKTTLLQTIGAAMAARYTSERLGLTLIDYGQNDDGLARLTDLPHAPGGVIAADDAFEQAVADLRTELARRKASLDEARQMQGAAFDPRAFTSQLKSLVWLIDDYDALQRRASQKARDALSDCLSSMQGRGLAVHVIVAGSDKALSSYSVDEWAQLIRDAQVGFVMGGNQSNVFTVRPAPGESAVLTAGEGYFVRRTRSRRFKAAFAF